MKTTRHILSTVIASLSMVGASAQAEPLNEDNAREHKVTVSLKAFYEGPEEEDEKNNGDETYSQKILQMKISNKEILEGFVDENLIDDIKGWSIVLLTDNNAEIVGTFLTKKNNFPIDVTEYFEADGGPGIEEYKGKYSDKKDLDTGTATYMSLAALLLEISGVAIEVQGILEANTDFSQEGGDDEEEFVKTADFTNLSGIIEDPELGPDEEGLVTGSIKAAKGKKLTFNLMPL
jgi:hypothetical protein